MWKKNEIWSAEKVKDAMLEGPSQRARAFKGFLVQFYPAVRSFAVQFGLSKEDSDEIIADVFLSIARRLESDDSFEKALFSTYVLATIKNRCLYVRKNIQKTITLEEYTHQPITYDSTEQKMLVKEVLEKVKAMGDPCKTILMMRSEGFEHSEIAAKLNLAVQTVKAKTMECRKILINLLGGKTFYRI
ncbi:MAG: sigma-70 family RNA polymerase sigma factor [Bacteroidota bacterium]